MKLKGLLFIPLAGALASLAFAAASALPVAPGTNQAGGADLVDCQTNHVVVGYTDVYNPNHGWLKTEVKLHHLQCFDIQFKGPFYATVVLTHDGAVLWTSPPTLITGADLTIPIVPPVDATLVNDVHVSISTQ